MLPMLLRRQRSAKPPSRRKRQRVWQARRRKLQKHLPPGTFWIRLRYRFSITVNTSVSDSTASNGNQFVQSERAAQRKYCSLKNKPRFQRPGNAGRWTRKNDTAYENSHVGRPETTARQVFERARRSYRREAQRKNGAADATAKAAADLAKVAAAAAVKAVQAVIGMLAGLIGGTALFVIFCVVILIAAIAASPFWYFSLVAGAGRRTPQCSYFTNQHGGIWARLAELRREITTAFSYTAILRTGRRWRRGYSQAIRQEPRTVGCGFTFRRRPGGAFANYLWGYVFDFQRGGNHRTTGQRPWR